MKNKNWRKEEKRKVEQDEERKEIKKLKAVEEKKNKGKNLFERKASCDHDLLSTPPCQGNKRLFCHYNLKRAHGAVNTARALAVSTVRI